MWVKSGGAPLGKKGSVKANTDLQSVFHGLAFITHIKIIRVTNAKPYAP